jgi:hypothetical protein
MVRQLQPRASTDHRALSLASQTQSLGVRRVPYGFYTSMLDQDFNQQHYAYDEMGLEFDGVDYEHGDDVISRLLARIFREQRVLYRRAGLSRLGC